MSIQCVYTSEPNEGVDSNMTVGTNIDISASATSPNSDVASTEKCFALPYQVKSNKSSFCDHDYGAPSTNKFIMPPEKEESIFDSFHHDKNIILSSPPLPQPVVNGFTDIDSNSCQSTATDYSDINDITRCICGFDHDDGYMICCDKCSVWQHIDCMQIDRNAIPDTYSCELCQPRAVDQAYAIKLQTTKREEFLAHDSESGTEDEKLKDGENVTYTAIQSTPTSMTITSNRHKKGHHHSAKRRKRSADSHLPNKKTNRDGKRRPQARFRSKSLLSSGNDLDSLWVEEIRKWQDSYITIDTNGYTESLRTAVKNVEQRDNLNFDNENILHKLTAQLAKVQRLRDTLLAMEDIAAGQPIIEYKGSFMLTKSFENDGNDIKRKPYPYVLFYNSPDGLGICVDSRSSGNIARFVRRSCNPNSEVRHVIDSGELRLFIFCKDKIKKNTEITIPFDFSFDKCSYAVSCSCSKGKDCPIYTLRSKRYLNKKYLDGKLIFPAHTNGISHTNGYASSDDLTEADDLHQRKKSREERKMESYIRAFKELEKKEKKKEMQQHVNHTETKLPSLPPLLRPENIIENTQITTTTVQQLMTQTSTSVVTTTTPVDTVLSSSSTVVTTVPQKCSVRRRSNRVRRVSRKLQTGISDNSHCAKLLISNELSKSIASLENFPTPSLLKTTPEVENSISLNSTSVTTLSANLSTSSTEKLSLSAPSIVMMNNNVPPDLTPSNNENFLSAECTPSNCNIELSDCQTSHFELPSTTIDTYVAETNKMPSTWNSHASISEACETTKASISLKLVKSSSKQKRPSSTVEWISGRSTSPIILADRPRSASICSPKTTESSVKNAQPHDTSSLISKPTLPVLTCNVVPWDFLPGVPTGMVHIKACGFNRQRTTFTKTNIKKRWLKQIEEDKEANICTKCQFDNCIGNCQKHYSENTLHSLPLKKRKVLKEPQISNEHILTETPIQIDKDIAVLSTEDVQNALGGTECIDFSIGPEILPQLHPKIEITDLPISYDEKVTIQQDHALSTEYSNNEVNPAPLSTQNTTDETSEMCSTISLPSDTMEYNDQPPSAVKRKVSLQEYLKRSKPKETRPEKSLLNNFRKIESVPENLEEKSDKKDVKSNISDKKPAVTDINHEATKTLSPVNEQSCKISPKPNETKDDDTDLSLVDDKKLPEVQNNELQKQNNPQNVPQTVSREVISPAVTLDSTSPKITEKTQKPKIQDLETKPNNHKNTSEISAINNKTQKKVEVRKPLLPTPNVRESSSGSSTPKDGYCDHKSSRENLSDATPPGRSPATVPSYNRSRHNSNSSSTSSRSPKVMLQDQCPSKNQNTSHTPKGMPIPRTLGRRNSGGRIWNESRPRKSPPRKVPSLTPAVPGQPIPSVLSTRDGRGPPQRIYNRDSPRRDIRTPSPDRWRQHCSYMPEPHGKYHHNSPNNSNTNWRRHNEYDNNFRRDSFHGGGYSSNPPIPRHFNRNNSYDQSMDRPYSPKQHYYNRHDNDSNYNTYNDHPPPFHKQHSNPSRSYSPKGYSPNNNSSHYDPPYSYSAHPYS